MEPSEPPDPPGDGHPLPPADEWDPAEGDLARLGRGLIADGPVDIAAGTAVTVTGPPDEDGYVPVAAMVRVTSRVPLTYLHKETT